MKFNFRKIASVLASAVMVSSSVGMAAAANFGDTFVPNGVSDVAVVYGAPADLAAAMGIANALSALVTDTDSSEVTTITGESEKLEESSDWLNLGEDAGTVYDDTLDVDVLSKVLADGVYENGEGDEFDYNQEISLSNNLGIEFSTDDDDIPFIGMALEKDDEILNYTLVFEDPAEGGASFEDLEDTYIEMLGREYYISEVSSTGSSITLLDSANSLYLVKGEPQDITLGDEKYTVELTYSEGSEAVVKVGSELSDKLDEDDDRTDELKNGVVVTLLNNYPGSDADIDAAEVSFGAGEIILTSGEEVELNGEVISDIEKYNDAELYAFIANDTANTEIDNITLQWILGNDQDVMAGDEIVMPGLEAVKVVYGGFVFPTEETTSFVNRGTKALELETVVEDGEVTLPLLYYDSGVTYIGEDATTKLHTSSTVSSSVSLNISDPENDDQFVITWFDGDEGESYVLEFTGINSDDEAKFENVVAGGDPELLGAGDQADYGEITLEVDALSEASNTVNITISSSAGDVTFGHLVTKEGLLIELPTTGANLTAGVDLDLVEESAAQEDDGDINAGIAFTVTLGLNGDNEPQVDDTNVTNENPEDSGSDLYIGYVESGLATKTVRDTAPDQTTLDVVYHGKESYAEVFVAEAGATSNGGGSTGTITPILDTQASSVSSKNLIVVGGSCVNSVARKLVASDATAPVCGAAWTEATDAEAGQWLIQTFQSPYSSSKLAVLVAGWEVGDTANAANAVRDGTSVTDFKVGQKKIGQITAIGA